MAERMGFDDFIEASAKTNHKVEGIFEKAVSQVSTTMRIYTELDINWQLQFCSKLANYSNTASIRVQIVYLCLH